MFFDNIRIKQDCYLNLIVNLPGRLSISTFLVRNFLYAYKLYH